MLKDASDPVSDVKISFCLRGKPLTLCQDPGWCEDYSFDYVIKAMGWVRGERERERETRGCPPVELNR